MENNSTSDHIAINRPHLEDAETGEDIDLIERLIRRLLQPMNQRIQELQGQVHALKREMTSWKVQSAQNQNAMCGTGHMRPFLEVPFPDGTSPSETGYPPLKNVDNIKNLTPPEAQEYTTRYELVLDAGAAHLERLQALARYIGCSPHALD